MMTYFKLMPALLLTMFFELAALASPPVVSETCKAVVTLSPKDGVFPQVEYQYNVGVGKAGRKKCVITTPVTLCSGSPALSGDDGYQIAFSQENNPDFIAAVRDTSDECSLLEDLGGELQMLVVGKGISVTGAIQIKPRPPKPPEDPAPYPIPTSSAAPGANLLCQHSWEEKPGTADYTTINWFENSLGNETPRRFDRPQNQTLQGNPAFLSQSMCQRASLLKFCFAKSAELDREHNAPTLYHWARDHGLDYSLMLMAFAAQETNLGAGHDEAVSGVSNGIGMMQIVDAYDSRGNLLSTTDSRNWDGVTYNILTNLGYASRIMDRKLADLPSSAQLKDLASAYNGNPNLSIRNAYARGVPAWYAELKKCHLP